MGPFSEVVGKEDGYSTLFGVLSEQVGARSSFAFTEGNREN
jgi:hypothetical protein